MTTDGKPRIALFAAPETSASVLYGLYDVLVAVGPVWSDMIAGESQAALLDVSIVAVTSEPFRCFGDVPVEPHAAIDALDEFDAVIVCDLYAPLDSPPRGRYATESDWLRRMHERGAVVASVCTGSLLLAEAGLLDGRSCAGHWAYRDLFRTAYPRVRFDPAAILDLTSERDRLLTAGGVTAWQDLALRLIARFCGADQAVRTAKVYLFAGHEDGQLPFSAMTRRAMRGDAVIRECADWIAAHYETARPVAAMTLRSGLTPRTFARRFEAASGYRPMEYVHALRIEGARAMLETGRLGVDDVGYAVGYEDASYFRRLFKRAIGMTPSGYRRKYASIVGR